jgi:hypothetical protein
MRWVMLVIGALALLMGAVWTLQGLDILKGSGMSGQTTFVIVGPIVALVGLALLLLGLRMGRGAPTA